MARSAPHGNRRSQSNASSELLQLSAVEVRARFRSGAISVETYARACLDRIRVRDPDVKAWTFLDSERIISDARELDRSAPTAPLHGLPIGVKDVYLTIDMPTQYNSPIYRNFFPQIDSSCVAVLRRAGALVFGKTDTVEFASNARRALTRNPRDLSRTPGGSSSGSAAAVADFHVPLSLGSQTVGSTIRPASYCGIPAMKPTWGIVSTEGLKNTSPTLDTVGWYGRCVTDLALLLDVLAPVTLIAPDPIEIADTKLAICRSPAWARAESATAEAMSEAERRLRSAGAETEFLDLPKVFDQLLDCQALILRAEGRAAFLAEYNGHPQNLHPMLRELVESKDRELWDSLRRAYDVAAQCRASFDDIASEYDAILTPSATGEAPVGVSSTGEPVFNAMWTLLHVPCINLPGFTGPNGMPVGLTLVASRFADRALLATAQALEPLFLAQ